MEILIDNESNMPKEDVTEIVTRVKCIIRNSSNEIMLGDCDGILQFPGGHLEEGETLEDCVRREIKEETGITLNCEIKEPFFAIKHYNENWPEEGKNRLSELYYFDIETDQLINEKEKHYTEMEKAGNFTLRYVNYNDIEEVLKDNIPNNPVNEIIVGEMLDALEKYKRGKI